MMTTEIPLGKLIEGFPLEKPRDQQVQIMDWLDENWETKKFFMIDAPPGVGKSAVAMAAARHAERAYFLTSTKLLQDQYIETFSDVRNLKGKDNYDCGINPIFRVSAAPCVADRTLKASCIGSGVCPYYSAVDRAMNSPFMITSYAYFLMAVECGPLKERKAEDVRGVTICDEAHEIDSIMADFIGFEIDPKVLKSDFNISANALTSAIYTSRGEKRVEKMFELIGQISARLTEYERAIKGVIESALGAAMKDIRKMHPNAAKQSREIVQRRDKLDRIYKRMQRFCEGRGGSEADWLVSRDDEGKLIFSPLHARVGFRDYIASLSDRVIFMSASLGDPSVLADELGMDPEEYCSISVGTPFDPEKSPVYVVPIAKMDRNNIDASMPKMVEAVREIISGHPDEKGIVHTSNYRIAEAIVSGSPGLSDRLISKRAKARESNEELLMRHTDSTDPTVLVSPSMHTGVDLRGDLSRFQIMTKLPWPSLGDPRIAKKAEDRRWYANEMVKKLVQASGRSTRDFDDHSVTYILDAGFTTAWRQWHSIMPDWFKERVSLVE